MRFRQLLLCLLSLPAASPLRGDPQRFEKPPHDYWNRPLQDPFTLWLERVKKGDAAVPSGDERAIMRALLREFSIPESAQMLVYSATSRQRIISPSTPRALYFNDEIYIGCVPGGRIEVASLDSELGPVFYIFDYPRQGAIRADRSDRCMQCHAGHDNHQLPKLVIDSVIVNDQGGSLETWRQEKSGHQVPLSQRFGGWHLTGGHNLGAHHANVTGQFVRGKLEVYPNPPGKLFSLDRYLRPTSDVLPQLLFDHQAGFVNLLTEAKYRLRELMGAEQALPPGAGAELDRHAGEIVNYVLFKNEAQLPAKGIQGDAAYITDFNANKRASGGASLKDFDLRTRLFKHRCSYMLYTPYWSSLASPIKDRCWKLLSELLTDGPRAAAWLDGTERAAIRRILGATHPDAPPVWKTP